MSLRDYVIHYTSFPETLYFFGISFGVVLFVHFLLTLVARRGKKKEPENDFIELFGKLTEEYYELLFSSSCILLFVGIYFLISYDYFSVSQEHWQFWVKYEDYLLLGFIILSILFNNLIDHVLVPLKRLDKDTRGILRMAGMLYMLVIFSYIKFIDQNSNYDTILGYFLTLVIGRFVYFDAALRDFFQSVKKMKEIFPVVLFVLLSTALLSLYGFKSEYLLRSNGVVLSLFIAHFFCIVEICIIARTRLFERIAVKFSK